MMDGNRKLYLACCGGQWTEQQLQQAMDAETWLTAQECLDVGFATQVSDLLADAEEMQQLTQKAAQRMQSVAATLRQARAAMQAELAGFVGAQPAAPLAQMFSGFCKQIKN